MEKHPELVENTIILHVDSTAHSGYAVKHVPHCWGGNVANTVLILQISVCDYDLIPVLKQPLHGNDLQTEYILTAIWCKMEQISKSGDVENVCLLPSYWQ